VRRTLQRLAEYLPAALAAALPTLWITGLVDGFVLPRAALVIAGACVGVGLVLITARGDGVANLKWPLAIAAGAALLAFALSTSWPVSTVGAYLRYESWPMRISYLGLFIAAGCLVSSPAARDWVPRAFVIGTAVASAEAVFQAISNVPFRPDGNTGNAGLLGALIAMAIPISVSRSMRLRPLAPLWWLGLVILVAGLVASTSRSGGLGALAGTAALVVMSQRGRRALVAAAVTLGFIALGLLVILYSPLRQLNGDPGAARLYLWPDALRMIAARPITGWGEDTQGLVFGRFLRLDIPGTGFDRAHAGLLDLLATQGVIGTIAVGGLLVLVGVVVWRNRFRPAVAMLGAAGFGYTVWVAFNFDWAPATGPFWLLMGAAWSAAHMREPDEARTEPLPTASVSIAAQLAAIGLVAVGIGLGVLPLVADSWYSHGRADLAVLVDPLQPQYHRANGENLVAAGQTQEGLDEMRAAADLGDSDPAFYVELGDVELSVGDRLAAINDYRRALLINPYWTPAQARLASLKPTP
jgi:O-antigen ligase